MWLFTIYGFFSVVVKGNTVYVRARNKRHLINLKKRFRVWIGAVSIQEDVGTDYKWRIGVSRKTWGVISEYLAAEITWDNFKHKVKTSKLTDKAYLDVLHDVWFKMMQYQRRTHPKVKSKLACMLDELD